MKHLITIAALALWAAPLHADGFKRITTEAGYSEHVVGKRFCNDSGCWIAKKNGRMTGKFGKDAFKANWAWRKTYACRTGKLGKRDIGTDCQTVEVSGKKVRITRNQGKGKQVVYATK